jgi:hypothetical protein
MPVEYVIFREYILGGKPWNEVLAAANRRAHPHRQLDRSDFSYATYRAQEIVGKELARTRLFPARAYFGSHFTRPPIYSAGTRTRT